jgi:hypothetical protein
MRTLRLLALSLSLLALPAPAWSQSPSVDYYSFLSGVKANENGTVFVDQLVTVFVPQDAIYTGAAAQTTRFYVTLERDGEELQRLPHILQPLEGVFARLQVLGVPPVFKIAEPGRYTIKVLFDGDVISSLPFEARFVGGDDEYAPAKKLVVSGPWSRLAALTTDPPNDPEARLGVSLWPHGAGTGQEKIDARVVFGGRTVYETRYNLVSALNPARTRLELQFATPAGGDYVRVADFTRLDGVYELVVRIDENEVARYRYEVAGGKIKPNPRSAFDYEPHVDYLSSRTADPINHGHVSEVFWAEVGSRGVAEEPGPAATPVPVVTGPTAADLARWQVEPSYDAKRPFLLTHTRVAARADAALAAGDDIIAFGTGAVNGVAYINVGDADRRPIPEGQSFSSAFVEVAGKKIVLVSGSNVAVFDTATGVLAKIPDDEIHLGQPVKNAYEANPLDVSGYLVATINDASKVNDRAVVKMIDVSGPEPVVFALANADFESSEATAVAVDAATGLVAVSSRSKSAIYTAEAASGAELAKHDLGAYDGIASAPLLAGGGFVAYRDGAGKAKLRLLDPGGEVQTIGTLGPPVLGYAMNGPLYAYATTDGFGSDYAWATAEAPAVATPVAGTGDAMIGGNGKLGYGQTAAIAPDGTLFIGGSGKGGLGSGEFLMVLTGGAWQELTSAQGKTLPACDVVVGNGLLAFKSGRGNDTMISYATFGSKIAL